MMDFDITGDETPEQLEAMLEKIGDVDVGGNGPDEPHEGATENLPSEQTQTESGDNTVPTPGTRAAEEKPQEEVKGILTRDGKHVIPYDIPCPLVMQDGRAESVIITMIKKKLLNHD
ncbi:hypothetical protein GKA92_24110 [Salmonella enterica subsp. enterica]|nr:hypothetical protein [Salmonella enterica subsp. enterica serovar Abaetetuba]